MALAPGLHARIEKSTLSRSCVALLLRRVCAVSIARREDVDSGCPKAPLGFRFRDNVRKRDGGGCQAGRQKRPATSPRRCSIEILSLILTSMKFVPLSVEIGHKLERHRAKFGPVSTSFGWCRSLVEIGPRIDQCLLDFGQIRGENGKFRPLDARLLTTVMCLRPLR